MSFFRAVSKRTVIVMDQASIHTSDAMQNKLEEWQQRQIEIFRLPSYSPQLNRVGDIFPAALRRSSRACNPNLGFGSKAASITRPLAAGFLIEILW